MGLMRRIPPKHTETALSALLSLMPNNSSDLLAQVDQPLQVLCDVECGKEFILCEYNRDADSYRSPWSNIYHPPLEDGSLPSLRLRELEVEANDIFAIYRDQYYEGGISSVYMWEDDNEGFVACFLIKKDGSKTGQGRRGYLEEGAWDAIHVIEVGPEDENNNYRSFTTWISIILMVLSSQNSDFNIFLSIIKEGLSLRGASRSVLSTQTGFVVAIVKKIQDVDEHLKSSISSHYFVERTEAVNILNLPLHSIIVVIRTLMYKII
ncbi:F-actin-capping protein [Vigna angularis]|uniref:F-actin-capping protein subunit beta n=1 Tax=Phaseolus angularis TaxID=3914 RepID=A0A8T0KRG8_PHAAN|nr:F-actin-capping protein [Vigna angularis]